MTDLRQLYQPILLDDSQIPHKALGRLDDFVIDHPAGGRLASEHDRGRVNVEDLRESALPIR